MSDSFAAAVDAYREALARFDCPRGIYADADPRWPEDRRGVFGGVWVDYCGMREATVLAEEAELERRFGRGTRSAGGGGETVSPAGPQLKRKERPTLGDKQSEGWKRRKAAKRQQEEERKMPRGKMGPSDEQLLDEAKTFAVSFTTDALLERLAKKYGKDAPGYETLHKRLAGLRKRGILVGGRGLGKGAPTVWAITGRDTKARPAPGLLVSAAASKAAKEIDAAAPLPPSVDIEITQATGDRLVEFAREIEGAIVRGAQRRVARALRAEADLLEAAAAQGVS